MQKYEKALVLGCGRSGRAAEAMLRGEGATVVSVSEESSPDYTYESLGFDPEIAIVSPGFSLEHVWVKELMERGVPLLSEVELGWSRRHCPVIAVTGSNGKSTVVKWIVEALAQAGISSIPCGNYGFPISDAVMQADVPDWLVVEVSSFQLETVRDFRPDIGVLLNVLPNHLDRHGDMETYRTIKLRLFEKMTESDIAVVPFDFPILGKEQGHSSNVWKTFGTEEGADFRFDEGRVGGIDLRGTGFNNEILGASAAAVAAVLASIGLPESAVENAARSFEPLPHRMQIVAEIEGVRYIDDSKATNLAAMCAALRMTPGRVHLIAGGRAKETELSFAKDLLAQHVSHLYLIGEASTAMEKAWKNDVSCQLCGTLENAVSAAREQARAGETVLLSPACTSFDQFRSFAERGEVFAREVSRSSGTEDV